MVNCTSGEELAHSESQWWLRAEWFPVHDQAYYTSGCFPDMAIITLTSQGNCVFDRQKLRKSVVDLSLSSDKKILDLIILGRP
jgi:hypothetical protein